MHDKRVALITGANQGVDLQVAKELANGLTVLVGSRNFERGEVAAKEIGPGAVALQIDATDRASITAAAQRVHTECGRLDLLINNAGISNTRKQQLGLSAKISLASNASLDEIRAVWETNVFGVLAVYQAMRPLLRESSDARIVNVSSGVGSLTTNANPTFPYDAFCGPVYPASKAALNAITLALFVEPESTGIKVNLVSPGFTKTNLNGYEGTEPVEEGSREVVRVALLGPDRPSGTFTRGENTTIPWRSVKPKTYRSARRRLRRRICAAAQPSSAPRAKYLGSLCNLMTRHPFSLGGVPTMGQSGVLQRRGDAEAPRR
jgi:NAD(P)-dependent dehydrogenase (short-subunit alcohol dehydrogenase family)